MKQNCKTIVLIGTYKTNQLEKWPGYYNYPISDADKITDADAARINELWLFKGTVAQKSYAAEFVGVKTREELISNYAYPAKGKAHSEKYLLFKTTPIEAPSTEYCSVILRTKDFTSSKKIQAQLKAYLESNNREKMEVTTKLPDVAYSIPKESLTVCESAFQMSFWDLPELAELKPTVPFPPPNNPKFQFIDLFAGIGGFHLAMHELGGECIFASEWDKDAQNTYEANYGIRPFGDITKREIKDAIPEHFDVLCAGFPCQAFSHAGLKKGFADTRGTLFHEIATILNERKPKVAFLENVKGLISHDKGRTLKTILQKITEIGYRCNIPSEIIQGDSLKILQAEARKMVLSAKDFGVCQNRQRIYIVLWREDMGIEHFNYPIPPQTPTQIKDILDDDVDDKYTISDRMWKGHQDRKERNRAKGKGFGYSLVTPNMAYTNTISARYWKDGSEILIAQNGKNPRTLTPREAIRLQGFPDSFILNKSNHQAYKQAGNSVAVPVVYRVAEQIVKQLLC